MKENWTICIIRVFKKTSIRIFFFVGLKPKMTDNCIDLKFLFVIWGGGGCYTFWDVH